MASDRQLLRARPPQKGCRTKRDQAHLFDVPAVFFRARPPSKRPSAPEGAIPSARAAEKTFWHVLQLAISYAILSIQHCISADRSVGKARASIGTASMQLAARMCSAHRSALAAAGKRCGVNACRELQGRDLRAKEASNRFHAAWPKTKLIEPNTLSASPGSSEQGAAQQS